MHYYHICFQQTHDEFLELVNICGLVAEEREGIEMTEVLPSRCLNWPFSNSVMTIRSWCQQLEEVLLAKGGKEKKIDMVCEVALFVVNVVKVS